MVILSQPDKVDIEKKEEQKKFTPKRRAPHLIQAEYAHERSLAEVPGDAKKKVVKPSKDSEEKVKNNTASKSSLE